VSIEQEIMSGRIQNGVYRGTLSAYDPIMPMIIQLIDEKGNLVASASESVRQSAPPSVRWGRRRAPPRE
jgi:small nuclear ribonucleoprotein (snRNP)-like protein